MPGVDFIEHKGKRILYEDYSGCTPKTIAPYLEKAKQLISKEPPTSIRALVNVTNARFDMELASVMKDFVKQNTAYIKCSAIFGLVGLQAVLYRTIVAFTGRSNLAELA
jgi:hypothetical protein